MLIVRQHVRTLDAAVSAREEVGELDRAYGGQARDVAQPQATATAHAPQGRP